MNVVVPERDHVELARSRQRPPDVVVVDRRDPLPAKLRPVELRVDLDVRIRPRVRRDAVEIAVVVAEQDVDGPGEPEPELVHNERRAEVAEAHQGVGLRGLLERRREIPDIVVYVGENGDAHSAPA